MRISDLKYLFHSADERFAVLANGKRLYELTTAVTANSTTTTAPAGSFAVTSHATGRNGLFYSDGSKWQSVAGGWAGGGGSYEVATESPATGSNDTFTFSGPPTLVFRNGVMETRLGSVVGSTFVFDSAPSADDDIEGLV